MFSESTAGKQRKHPILPMLVREDITRPAPALVEALVSADVTRLSEMVGLLYTMNAQLRPLYQPAQPLCGPAVTVKCPAGDNLGVMQALRLVQPGDVLVIDAQGFTSWCVGGFEMLELARHERGLAGVVVNGAYRDVEELKDAAFPIYGLAVAPNSGPKFGPAEVNVPVSCGGVVVHPGDVVSASAEGIVVVPAAAAGLVAEAIAQKAQATDAQEDRAHIRAFMADMDRIFESYESAGLLKRL